jgi:hypothetical protein
MTNRATASRGARSIDELFNELDFEEILPPSRVATKGGRGVLLDPQFPFPWFGSTLPSETGNSDIWLGTARVP